MTISPTIQTQLIVYILSMVLALGWILNTKQSKLKIVFDDYGNCSIIRIPDEEPMWYLVAALSLASFWTVFWNGLLIKLLQCSRRIERSAVFLFQQSILMHLIAYGFLLTVVVKHVWLQTETLGFDGYDLLIVALAIEQLFYCLYIGLRMYLTYRRNGTIRVIFAYKIFFFLLTSSIPSVLLFVLLNRNGDEVFMVIFALLGVLTIVMFIFIFKRRQRLPSDKIQHHTTWIWFLIVASYTGANTVKETIFEFQLDFICSNREK